MSLIDMAKKAWKKLTKWVKQLGKGKRDKTPNPVTNFTVEQEQ